MVDLPQVIPLFPLPNVVLFPRMPLPLHIFEPRYRAMVRDAAQGHKVIGMVLLRGNWERDYEGCPDIFRVGTGGILTEVEALTGGRFNIILVGTREFRVEEEILDRPYRQARVAWSAPGEVRALPADEREQLASLACLYLETRHGRGRATLVGGTDVDDEVFVNFLSQGMDFTPLEKQGLLEASGIVERAQRLREVLEFRLAERRTPDVGARRTH
jgi:Lon protease-like protein